MTPLEMALIVIIFLLVVGIFLLIFVRLNKPKAKNDELNMTSIDLLSKLSERIINQNNDFNDKFKDLNNNIKEKIDDLSKKVDDQLKESLYSSKDFFKDFSEKLGKIDEAQKNLGSLETNILDLNKILKGNQTRGKWGELTLSNLLASVFGDYPDGYSEQYTIKNLNGDMIRPDAVVYLSEPNHIICIDSKFPFSNYEALLEDTISGKEKDDILKQFKKEVQVHINKVKEYIIPNLTAPFAILFLPSDGIMWFVNTHINDIVNEARNKNVILSSPSTLHALLATINFFNKQVKRTKNLKAIENQLVALEKEFDQFKKRWEKFTNRFDALEKSKDELNITSNKITKKFTQIIEAKTDKIGIDEIIDEEYKNDE